MLNYCVRNGNRWIHPGIVTRCFNSLSQSPQFYALTFPALQPECLAHSKLHRRNLRPNIFFDDFKLSSRLISTSPLRTLLYFYSRPIYLVLFKVPSKPYGSGKPHLKAGFTLRCFQRLSFPNVATQLYPWRDNWYTIGSSTPVLSY